MARINGIVLIRHAETDLAGKFCGHSEPDLNAAGEQRLRSLAEEVAPLGIKRIYSSDLRRASRTAAAIGDRIDVTIELRSGLREIHFGLWEGLSWEQVEQQYPDEAGLWARDFPTRPAPHGEPYADFSARVEAEFNLIFRQSEGILSAVVTHRGVLQYALTRFFGFSEADARSRTQEFGAIIVVTQIEHSRSRSSEPQIFGSP